MLFQRSTQYTLQVFIYLATHEPAPHSVKKIATDLDMPYKFMTKLMHKISASDLLVVEQGKYGGYSLQKSPDKIALEEIVAINENIDQLNECIMGLPECSDVASCPFHGKWSQYRKEIKTFLKKTSLNDLLQQG